MAPADIEAAITRLIDPDRSTLAWAWQTCTNVPSGRLRGVLVSLCFFLRPYIQDMEVVWCRDDRAPVHRVDVKAYLAVVTSDEQAETGIQVLFASRPANNTVDAIYNFVHEIDRAMADRVRAAVTVPAKRKVKQEEDATAGAEMEESEPNEANSARIRLG